MLGYVRPYRGQLALACTAALLSVLFTLLGPVFIGRAVDQVLGPGQVNFAGVAFWLALLAASTLAAGAAQWALGVCTRKVSALAANDMRLAAFRNLSRLPLAYFDSHPHGDIISRMTNDAELVAEGLLQGLTQLLPGVATILGTLGIMAVLNPFIAFVVVAVTPVSIWFAGFVAKRTAGFFAANSAAQGRLSGFVNEMVAGQEVVRAFGCEAACEAQFAEMTDELVHHGPEKRVLFLGYQPRHALCKRHCVCGGGRVWRRQRHWRGHYGGPAFQLSHLCQPVHKALQRGDGRAYPDADGPCQRRAPAGR